VINTISTDANISGIIQTETGLPISGVTVTLSAMTAKPQQRIA